MTYRLRNIVLAVVLATLAALLTSFYVSNYKKTVEDAHDNVTVYVAKRDIPPGTSGSDALSRGMIREVKIARGSVVPGAISSTDQISGDVATEWVYAEEQVSERRFRPVEESGIRAKLKGNVRAVQISGDSQQLLAGTLKRGDHVDIVGNFKFQVRGDDRERAATRVVLRDLLVLRAPTGPGSGAKVASPGGMVAAQLAVTDAQAQKLFFTLKNGDWSLQLRPVVEAADSPESLETLDRILCDGMRRNVYGLCFGR